jgi:squalene-hopene/tetraprenyl-beta-curcumene cyclase
MGLLAIGNRDLDPAIRRGVTWLLKHQTNSTWTEPQYVGCGFPGYGIGEPIDLNKSTAMLTQGRELARGFMLNYNMYRHNFPLQALGRARQHFRSASFLSLNRKTS